MEPSFGTVIPFSLKVAFPPPSIFHVSVTGCPGRVEAGDLLNETSLKDCSRSIAAIIICGVQGMVKGFLNEKKFTSLEANGISATF